MFRLRLQSRLQACAAAVLAGGLGAAALAAQAPPVPPPGASAQAQASTEFVLGKWAELQAESQASGKNGADYVEQALQHYAAALAADPHSAYIASQSADLFSRLGRMPEAINLMNKVVAEHPDSVVAHQTLGRIYLRQLSRERQPIAATEPAMQQAVAEYQALIRLQPKEADPVVVLGKLYGAQGDAAGAEREFRAALALAPTNLDALASLVQSLAGQNRLDEAQAAVAALPPVARTGQVFAILGDAWNDHHDTAKAAEAYREAIAAQPDVPEYRDALAKALTSERDYQGALDAYLAIERLAPDNGDAALRAGQLQLQLGQFDAAGASLHTAAQLLGPGNIEVGYAQALLASAQGHDAQAITDLEALAARKNSPAAASIFLTQLARLEMANGQKEAAAKHLSAIEALGPNYRARAHALEIELYSQARDFPQALAAVRTALADEPQSRSLHLTEANLLAASGQIGAAKSAVKVLEKNDAGDWDLYLALGQIEAQGHDLDQAAKDTARAGELAPNAADHAKALAQLAGLAARRRDLAGAEKNYRAALALDPQNPAILNGLGYTLAEKGAELPQALGYVQQALARDANNGSYVDSLGWVYFKMNRLPEAVTNLERAARLQKHDPAILDHLAQAYEGDGKLQQAATSWQKALDDLKLDPGLDHGAERSKDIEKKLSEVRSRLAQKQ